MDKANPFKQRSEVQNLTEAIIRIREKTVLKDSDHSCVQSRAVILNERKNIFLNNF